MSSKKSVLKQQSKSKFLYRIYSIIIKEIRTITKDKTALIMVFILPGMVMLTTYVAVSQGTSHSETISKHLNWGIVDNDPTDTYPGQDLSKNFSAYFELEEDLTVYYYKTEDDAKKALYYDEIDLYIVIPYGFEGNVTAGIAAVIPMHVSSSSINYEGQMVDVLQKVVDEFRSDHGWMQREIETRTVREFLPSGNFAGATIGAFIVVFAAHIAVASTAGQSIVGDIPLGRMLLTPLSKFEAIVGKLIGHTIFGLVQGQFLLVLWIGLFNLQLNASYLELTIILALMSLSGAGMGIIISVLTSTRLQANQGFLFLLFANFILSGGVFDVGIIDKIMPMNQGRMLIMDAAFRGISIFTNWIMIVKVLLFTVFAIIFSTIVFAMRRKLA